MIQTGNGLVGSQSCEKRAWNLVIQQAENEPTDLFSWQKMNRTASWAVLTGAELVDWGEGLSIIRLHSSLLRPHLDYCAQFCSPPVQERHWQTAPSSPKVRKTAWGWNSFLVWRGRGSLDCLAVGRDEFKGTRQVPHNTYGEVMEKTEPHSAQWCMGGT